MTTLRRPEFAPPSECAAVEDPARESIMPFIGSILEHVPQRSITIERTLDLAEDLYLADHVFVHAPGIKPLSACLPVLPMTVSLEIMAEAAACLAQGHGLIGFECVKATRWIELADTETLTLRIEARHERVDPERQIHRVAAAIHVGKQTTPAISADVLLAPRYQLELAFAFTEFSSPRRHPLTGEQLYRERLLFHGPSYQCLVGDIILGEEGATGELLVKSPTENQFRSIRRPQLLTDPQLLDAVGQLVGVWAMERERYVFPIGIEKLELYRPTPPAGTRVPVHVEIVDDEAKTLRANIEIQDGAGGVWMRIRHWRMWKFRWERRFVEFRRTPTRRMLSEPLALPSLPPTAVCQTLSAKDLSNFDAGLLARFYLHVDEMPEYAAKAAAPQRQMQWLFGRVAAKDAARAWLERRTRDEAMAHPAAFAIENDARGRPSIKYLSGDKGPPRISIAHCEDRAIAIAHDGALGVDIELIRTRDQSFLEVFSTAAERNLLIGQVGGGSSDQMAEWITRLWCAKEAAGKLLETGVEGGPKKFEATGIDAAGAVRISHGESGRPVWVRTVRDADFIIAYATLAVGPGAECVGIC